jgi:Holliday junction DNA helicase RuvA
VETRVSQDAITLFGFFDATERDAFLALIEVKTVGPQKALLVLSGLTPGDLARAIAAKERKRLADVKGLGAATATRIVDEPAMQKWAVGRAMPDADGVGAAEAVLAPEPAGPAGGCRLGPGQPRLEAPGGRGRRRPRRPPPGR